MKKYLMFAAAAIALVGCNKMDGVTSQSEITQAKYDYAFKSYIGGEPAPDQTWGFSDDAYTRGFDFTRSAHRASVAEISQPYDEAWVTEYNKTAKEPTSANTTDNYDNSTYETNWEVLNAIPWDGSDLDMLRRWFTNNGTNNGMSWEETIAWALANQPTWIKKTVDEDYVTNFKITGTYSGYINVAASEGIIDGGTLSGAERTIVVTGTWNITDAQRIGSLGKIIIANGGTVNVASGITLNMVNEARLVVLPGGTLTGAGKVEVNNGNAAGLENYNGGTIDVAYFNNNFGKFYNYGKFLVNEYDAGATESNFYNHSLVAIDHTGNTPNARIFNGCQFYVAHDARLRNYEGIMGSALIVGGQLMPFGSEDGTSVPSFVDLDAGALVKCGSLYNGSSWSGPTSGGYAALEIVNQIDYLNWVQDNPSRAGYFANNLYVKCGTWQNDPAGQGKHFDGPISTEWDQINYDESRAEYKFWTVAANCTGNGNVTKVVDGNTQLIDADPDFILGSKGCTPGFSGGDDPTPPTPPTPPVDPDVVRIIAEDLSASGDSDFDFNDVVLDVTFGRPATVVLTHAGGTLPLRINGNNNLEVHKLFGVLEDDADIEAITQKLPMVNTGAGPTRPAVDISELVNVNINSRSEADSQLKLEVFKDGVWQEMAAPQGEPACKLAVDENFVVLPERTSIKGTYPLFVTWATTTGFKSKWW